MCRVVPAIGSGANRLLANQFVLQKECNMSDDQVHRGSCDKFGLPEPLYDSVQTCQPGRYRLDL